MTFRVTWWHVDKKKGQFCEYWNNIHLEQGVLLEIHIEEMAETAGWNNSPQSNKVFVDVPWAHPQQPRTVSVNVPVHTLKSTGVSYMPEIKDDDSCETGAGTGLKQ